VALFSKKPKVAGGPGVIHIEDEIFGYLDEVARQHGILNIISKKKKWECRLYSLDVNKKQLRIEDAIGLSEMDKMPVRVGFPLDGTYFMFTSKIIISGGKPFLSIPAAIQRKERRKKPRTSLSTREGAKAAVLQSLGAGVGVTGPIVELSEDAFHMGIERSIMLENERNLSPGPELLKEGTKMMVVKLSGINGVPTFTAEGTVLRMIRKGSWQIAIRMDKVPSKLKMAIGRSVTSRFMPYKPTRRSYQRRMEFEKERQQEIQSQEKSEPEKEEVIDTSDVKSGPITFATEVKKSPLVGLEPLPDSATEEPKEKVVPKPPPPPPPPKDPVILSIGETLKEQFSFLAEKEDYRWIHVDSPLRIIKTFNDNKTLFFLFTLTFKNQPMLEYVEKLSNMGVLTDVTMVAFSEENIPPKDVIKCRMAGIEHTLRLPLESPDQLLEIIAAKDSGQQ
jgi:hypothetical protein